MGRRMSGRGRLPARRNSVGGVLAAMDADVDIRIDRKEPRVQARAAGEVVGQVAVRPIELDWGGGTLVPMAGIGAVGTDERYRRQGLGRRMMQDAVELSRELGFAVGGVSTDIGNPARRLYTRSGYVYLFRVRDYGRPVGKPDPTSPPVGVEVRPYAPGDETGIAALWDRGYVERGFFGARVADVSDWLAQRRELLAADPQSVWVAARDGVVVGWAEYYRHWWDREKCAFLVDDLPDADDIARALLTRLECSLADAGLEMFAFAASRCQPRVRDVLLGLGCEPAGGWAFNVAVFDLAGLLARLQSLHAARLRAGGLDSWPGVLRIEMDDQTAETELPGGDEGRCIEVAGPYDPMVRILCGRVGAWEAYLRGHVGISCEQGVDARLVVDAFLGRYPWFHPRRDRW